MNPRYPAALLAVGLYATGLAYFTPQRQVELRPDRSWADNACVPTAAVEWARHKDAKLLFVKYSNSTFGHCYCVWWDQDRVYGYDWRGVVRLRGSSRDALAIAKALPVPQYGLRVKSAMFK